MHPTHIIARNQKANRGTLANIVLPNTQDIHTFDVPKQEEVFAGWLGEEKMVYSRGGAEKEKEEDLEEEEEGSSVWGKGGKSLLQLIR